jgi:hypothetical protein
MSRLKIMIVVLVCLATVILTFMFFVDKWYGDYQPTSERIAGQWYCSHVLSSEDWPTFVSGSCQYQTTTDTWPKIIFTDSGGVTTYSGIAQTGSGKYVFLPRNNHHEEIMELSLDNSYQMIDGFYLRDGEYIIKMHNINEFSIRLENGAPKNYIITFEREVPKFDLSILATFGW